MRPRQVHHMDVVAYASAVDRRPVATEDPQLLASPDGHLADVGHQVVRLPARVLADQAGRMRTDRVEVAQVGRVERGRSEEHTSELQSLMRISYAVFCLKKKKQ